MKQKKSIFTFFRVELQLASRIIRIVKNEINLRSPYRNRDENGKLIASEEGEANWPKIRERSILCQATVVSFLFRVLLAKLNLIFFHSSAFDECQVSRTQLSFALKWNFFSLALISRWWSFAFRVQALIGFDLYLKFIVSRVRAPSSP